MTYKGPWVFCDWAHGWWDSRKADHCLHCLPKNRVYVNVKPKCPISRRDGGACGGTPLEPHGMCNSHAVVVGQHLAELLS